MLDVASRHSPNGVECTAGGSDEALENNSEDKGSMRRKNKRGAKPKEEALGEYTLGQPEMSLDMFSEGSMEDHDAHVCRIFASLKNDKDSTFLVQLPEGFGRVFPSVCALQLRAISLHPFRRSARNSSAQMAPSSSVEIPRVRHSV